jgi:hypothetical protein
MGAAGGANVSEQEPAEAAADRLRPGGLESSGKTRSARFSCLLWTRPIRGG